jgi:hypothetical protein
LNRRRFLKYASVGIVAGAAAVGGATYYLSEKPKLPETVMTTSTSTSKATPIYGPPQIAGLAYTPTRVLNDKIYDIRRSWMRLFYRPLKDAPTAKQAKEIAGKSRLRKHELQQGSVWLAFVIGRD